MNLGRPPMYKKGNQGANTHGNCYITPGYRVLNWYGSIPLKWADDDRDLFSQPLSLSPPSPSPLPLPFLLVLSAPAPYQQWWRHLWFDNGYRVARKPARSDEIIKR